MSAKLTAFRHGLNDFAEQRVEFANTGKMPDLFDLDLAHQLYTTLLGPVEAVVKDRQHLIVVPSGVLTGLPFHLLVTEKAGRRQA